MMKLFSWPLYKKTLKLKGPVRTGRYYCDTCGKVRNHKKAAEWPETSNVKEGNGKNFQLLRFFNEDH